MKNSYSDRMKSTVFPVVAILSLIMVLGGPEGYCVTSASSLMGEMTPEAEDANEDVVRYCHFQERIPKKAYQNNAGGDKLILLLSSICCPLLIVPKKERYIMYGSLLI